MYRIQAEKLRLFGHWSRWRFLLWERGNTHIPFLKKLFLMLTESNSRNVLSKIITNNLEKLLIKIYRFQFFAPNLFALFMDLKSNPLLRLLCDFPKSSSVPFNLLRANVYRYLLLSLWILSFLYFPACSLNFGQPFTPKQWISCFLPKVLFQMRH